MKSDFESVTIVICTSNEVETLKKTVDVIVGTCFPADVSKIVIGYPDFVTEACLCAVTELSERYRDVPVVAYKQKKPGVGSSLREGIGMAESTHILIIDSDGSRDVDVVSKLIELAKENPGKICKTSRWLKKGSFHNYGRINYIANFLAQIFLKILFGNICTDMTDALQIVPADIYKSMRWEETDFPFFLEMVLKPMRLGCKYVETPVNCYGRTEGESKNSFGQKAGYLRVALHIRAMPKGKILIDTEL